MRIPHITVLKHNGFGLLAASALLSRFGDIIAGLGFVYLAYRMTGSESATTGVALAEVIPYLLFGLIGGIISDSLPKLRVMQAANWYRAGLEFLAVILLLTHSMPYLGVVIIPFLIQMGGVVYNPCSRAAVVAIVDKDQRVAANSVMSMIENLTAIIAPLLASSLLLFGDVLWLFFLLDALTFVIGALLLRRLGRITTGVDVVTTPDAEESTSVLSLAWRRITLFWGGVATSRTLILLFVSTFFAVFCGKWAWQMGVLFISLPHPQDSTWFYSTMLATYALAGIVASVALPAITTQLQLRHYRLAVIVWGLGFLIIGLAPHKAIVAIGVIVLGIGVSVASQSRAFLLQHHVPRWAIGQGFAAAAVLLYLADFLSLSIFGGLNTAIGVRPTVILSGAAMLCSLPLAALIGHTITTKAR